MMQRRGKSVYSSFMQKGVEFDPFKSCNVRRADMVNVTRIDGMKTEILMGCNRRRADVATVTNSLN